MRCHIRLRVVSALPAALWHASRAELTEAAGQPRTGWSAEVTLLCVDTDCSLTEVGSRTCGFSNAGRSGIAPVSPPNQPNVPRSAVPSSDRRGSDPALLPPGSQCLDRRHRHRCVGSGPVFCGHQAVPNTEEHSGEWTQLVIIV